MSSDQEQNDSQSVFNNLNKLNPDDESQNQSQSIPQKGQDKQHVQSNNASSNKHIQQHRHESKTVSNPPLQLSSKQQTIIPIQKKQLTLVRQNKPRLIIDHMILKNFKSYAGTQKIGPFHKNFTSIVGPNGSGKSNLIESMLFIFGFNASWMRLNKLHQLIHNSSAANNITSAAVEVHFKKILDNNDGTITQIPQTQFFIRRTVNTSSVSKYYLNGNDSTQLQIKTKLKSQGIDLTNNRFLILQGQVQQISQMKQKSGDRDKPGFLEYLQDIIGSNQFIDRIEQAVKQYNSIQETKHQKGQRMKMSQDQLRGMQQQKQQAIKYVKKQRKIFQIQSILQQVLRSNSAYQLKKVQSKVQQLQRRRDQVVKQQKQKMSRQAQRVRQIKRIRDQDDKINKQMQRDNQKLSQLSAQDKNLKSQIAYNSQDQVKYQKKIEQLNIQFTKIIQESDSIRKMLPKKQQNLNQSRQQLQQLKKQLSKHDRPQLRQKIKHIQNEIKKYTLQKTTFVDKHKTLSTQVNKQSQAKHQHKITQYKTQLQQNLQMKAKIQIAMEVANKEYHNTKQAFDTQVQERNKLRQQCSIIDNMIRQKSSQKFQQGQMNNLFNHIMKANIPGVIGRLGDLGDIPREYDEIITTSCNRLDNIVTETYQAASKVLQFLKKNKLGRATCIIMDKISQFRIHMSKPFQAPQGSVRLFDIIKPSSQSARAAFYFALSNTLYCQNIDFAMKLSFGDDKNRRRVLARKNKGFVIYEMNGTINTVYGRRGGFEKKAAAQKKKNQNQDREVQQKHHHLIKTIQTKNELCQQLQRRLKQFQSNFQTMRSQKVISQDKIKDLRDQLNDLQRMIQKGQRNKNSIENMQRQIKALQQQIQKIQKQIQKLQQILQQIQTQQKKHQTQQVTQMRQRYKTLRQQYTKLQKQVQKQQVLITTVQKRIKQNHSKKQSTTRQIQRLQTMIEKCKSDMDKIQKIGLQLLTSIQNKKNKSHQLRQQQQEIKRSLDQEEQAVRSSRTKIEQAKALVDNARREIRKAEQDYKLASLQLQRIRKMYVQMTSTYDFLQHIDQIQKMGLSNNSNNNRNNNNNSNNHDSYQYHQGSSILDVTLQNLSLDMSMSDNVSNNNNNRNKNSTNKKHNDSRMLDMKKVDKIDPMKDLSEDQLDAFLLFEEKLRASLGLQHTQLKRMQGKNLTVISQYKTKFLQYKQKLKQFTDVMQKQAQLKKLINELKQQRFQIFRQGFSIINSKLKQVYQLLTNGGDAQLELIDSLDPFSDGVNFSVRPPKKAWKEINKLSGGEKTLSSLSLIFALHYYKPTPLYFMDEIDAALDFKNVSIVGDYIKKRTKDAQFIIISLRNNMFDLADKLVGVYKTFDQTKVINLAAGKLLAKRHVIEIEQKKDMVNENENQNENIPKIMDVEL